MFINNQVSQKSQDAKNDLVKNYKVLSILGMPFFAVKSEEERSELQTIFWFKLREVSNIKMVPEPNITKMEELFGEVDEEIKRSKKWSLGWFKYGVAGFILVIGLVMKHFIFNVRIKKQICQTQLDMFYETTTETIEYARKRKIMKLAGIDNGNRRSRSK